MDTPDNRAGTSTGNPGGDDREQRFEHLKEDLTDTLGSARQQADAQFGQYRDTAADQIDALAKGAKSFVSELEEHDTLGMSDYLSDMAQSMSGLAGNLRGKSAEQLLHDGAELARSNPALFIAGSIAIGFGLSRFIKASSSTAATMGAHEDPAAGTSVPPSGGFGAHRPYETSVTPQSTPHAGLDTGITPAAPSAQDHPSDFATHRASASPDSLPNTRGEL
ncbi:hypothetical protein K9857_05285 [Pseudomonas sp. REP124]|uniref:hypothetical protein n=1 Tax=Pseudomonas sp. REP124 TaxID=2875731 RepID=UPI001CCFAA26|nr:hypothetical protein [Pseudomonas sp. REP124]MBZ9780960.1 hypothetical protein [Pseudomonas sp. REP124]